MIPTENRAEPRGKRAHDRRRDAQHRVGPVAQRAPRHHGQRHQRKAQVMDDPLEPAGNARNVVPATRDRDAVFARAPPRESAIARIGAPLRIVWSIRDDFDAMAALREEFGQPGAVGSDPDRFGRIVEPDDQDSQTLPPSSSWARRSCR